MTNARLLSFTVLLGSFLTPSLRATDLSRYREFELEANLATVAKQAGMKLGEAKVVHQRPAVIQELAWEAGPLDSVNGIVFSFLNGELFRLVVDYDPYKTDGLTVKDMIEALSVNYGTAADPLAEITVPSGYGGEETVKVIARWEDSQWSFNLVRFKYEPSFALVALSKRLQAEARASVDEADRLDRIEAPQREIARQNTENQEKQLQQDKARLANKPGFRP